jgi:GNAT superfamily N-acetyltransferase
MLIQPLSLQTLPGATALVDRVFSSLTLLERHSFAASLEPNLLPYALGRALAGVTQLRYWVLWNPTCDGDQADWLAMFSIDPDYRGQGLGKRLLNFAILQAKSRGKRCLRLYTSHDPKEAVAQTLYERQGFRVVAEERLWLDPCVRIYRELRWKADRAVPPTERRWQLPQALPALPFQSPLTRLMWQLP